MTVRLLTEAQAREEWSGNIMLIRQQRIAFADLGVMVLRTVVVLMVTLPLWRAVFPEMNFLPYWVALLIAVGALLISHVMAKDIESARRPQAWLMVFNRKAMWIRFRSYMTRGWSEEEPTVLAFDLEDIDHLVPLRFADEASPELNVRFRQPMEDAVIDAVLEENSRLQGGRRTWYKTRREPVMVEQDLQGLRIRWNGEYPTLREACEKLGLYYPIDPPLRCGDSNTGLLVDRPRITDAALEEVNALLKAGDRDGAVKVLREATGMSLAEARALVAQSGWQADGDSSPETPAPAAPETSPETSPEKFKDAQSG